jgi:hypothetical protein
MRVIFRVKSIFTSRTIQTLTVRSSASKTVRVNHQAFQACEESPGNGHGVFPAIAPATKLLSGVYISTSSSVHTRERMLQALAKHALD